MYSKIQGHGILFFDLDVVYFLLLPLFDIVVRCHYFCCVYRAVTVHRDIMNICIRMYVRLYVGDGDCVLQLPQIQCFYQRLKRVP